MYKCSRCDRSYTSQTSLARHIHNHSRTNQHVCPQCDVVFYRRDLLSRHQKSHQDGSLSIDGNRRRCHTACVRCRDLKIKCSGSVPCPNCAKADTRCQYPGSRNRISHLAHRAEVIADDMIDTETAKTPSAQNINVQDSHENETSSMAEDYEQALDVPMASASESYAFSSLDHLDFNMAVTSGARHSAVDSQTISAAVDMPALSDPFLYNTLSWPWHHENSFLHNHDSAIALPDDFAEPEKSCNNQHDDALLLASLVSNAQRLPSHVEDPTNMPSEPSACPVDPTTALGEDQQMRVIEELVQFASACMGGNTTQDRSSYWRCMSPKVAHAFDINGWLETRQLHFFQHLMDLYLEYFEPLWPFFSTQNLDANRLHPLLYLVLISIGAMYSDASCSSFGSMLHARVRTCLCQPIELELPDYDDTIWLAQARCHTRVAALYFAQVKAISYANQLGTLLVAQAKRLELFSATYIEEGMREFRDASGRLSDHERLNIWLRLEARRRIAFAIYRSEAYTNLLLQTKPLIYLGEIDLALPSCDIVYRGQDLPPYVCIQLIENDQTPGKNYLASDLYRIALEKTEPLPPLGPIAWDILLLGLLWPVWEYSRDQTMLERLTNNSYVLPIADGVKLDEYAAPPASILEDTGSITQKRTEHDHLESSSRKMLDLRRDFDRLLLALRKLEEMIPIVKSFAYTKREQSSVMSGLLIYHLIYLRLDARVADLHQVQHRQLQKPSVGGRCPPSVFQWLNSRRAYHAAKRAISIWSLISGECVKPANERIQFNLTAFTALHDAAVLLWAIASTVQSEADENHLILGPSESDHGLSVTSVNSGKIIKSFVNLYDTLSPGRWSSFAAATKGLVDIPFPQPQGNY